MKNNRFSLSMAGLTALIAVSLGQVSFAADKEVDCGAEYKKVARAVKASPEDVLRIVAEQAAIAPSCVCEIVKAAITATKAEKELVVQIVSTAAEIVPDETPTIIACAVNAAPQAARAIADKFGSGKGVVSTGKEPASTGKESGKTIPTPPEDPDFSDDFNLFHTGIGGIYLTTPSSGLSRGSMLPSVNN